MAQAVVRVQALDGGWETIGRDRYAGIHPEAIQCSANEWGSDTCRFILRRDPRSAQPDLSAFTPATIEVGGVPVWSGRVWETPTKEGQDAGISVEGRGWQYHLDDDVYSRVFVHSKMTEWRDIRSDLSANPATYPGAWQVEAGTGGITMALPAAATASTGTRCGVFLDLGPNNTGKRIVLTYLGGGAANLGLWVASADTVGSTSETNNIGVAPVATTSTTAAFTFTTARRYVLVYFKNDSVGSLTGSETSWVQITGLKVFSSTAYESGNASILKVSDIVKDALTAAPLLSQSTARIAATSFNIPDAWWLDSKTPREAIKAYNAYHSNRTRVDVDQVLRYDAFPTTPLYEAGAWQGVEFQDASANSGEQVYDQVSVEGTGPDGSVLRVKRTQTGTLVNRRGFHRTAILPIDSAVATTEANQLGDTWLANHKTTPLKGSMSVVYGGLRQFGGGGPVHPSVLLLAMGELIRFTDRVDPDTGAMGRDGRIASAVYDHDSEAASVEIDNERHNFEAFAARLGLVRA